MKQSFNEIKIQEDSKNNIDTNTYENLIFNKKKIAILLFDKLDKKIIVYKMKPKKNYRRKQGHRQPYTKLIVKKIVG